VKTYEPLRIHVWSTSGGKSAFKDSTRADELVQGVVSTILKKPSEDWLVVHHKPARDLPDIRAMVLEKTAGKVDPQRLHFLTWGNHAATNAFVEVPNVILAGTLFFRPSQYEALGRLAAATPDADAFAAEDRKTIEAGEHAHGILQALCRAAVRKCHGSQCAPCDAYIIASTRSGIGEQLADIIPGCTLELWTPIKRELKGKVAEAVEFLRHWFSYPTIRYVKFQQVMEAIKVTSAANFNRDIRRNPLFRAELAEMGLVEWGPRSRFTSFKRFGSTVFAAEAQEAA
jgi:hypothetical protein